MEKSTLIVMHGVGDSPPGASLLEVSQGLHAEGVAGLADDLVIDGIRFPRMRLDHPRFAEIIEVNWSDVARPTRNMFAIVAFVARIVLALLDVATTIARERRLWLPQVYIASLEALLVYCIYPPLVTMLWMTTQAGWQSTLAIGAGGVLVTAGLTFYLRRFQRALRAGWLWALAIALTTGAVAFGPLPVEAAVHMATYLYLFSQAATGVLLLIALVGVAGHAARGPSTTESPAWRCSTSRSSSCRRSAPCCGQSRCMPSAVSRMRSCSRTGRCCIPAFSNPGTTTWR